MKRIILRSSEERRLLMGHPWVYDNEIDQVLAGPSPTGAAGGKAVLEPGETADVESSGKIYLGRAFVNPHSKITARIYSPSKEGVDKGFFKRRIREALLGRSGPALDQSARIVFAEADFLPGLIVDRFTGWPLEKFDSITERTFTYDAAEAALGPPLSWLSVQFLCYAMDSRRDMILEALEEVLAAPLGPGMEVLGPPEGIVEKSAAKVRELEWLPLREGLIKGTFPAGGIVIFENGFPFAVHLEEGQKTGHFLDQKENRRLAASFAGGGRVLDAFSYTGGFGIHAARAGALSVISVDSSVPALETVKQNAGLNGVSNIVTTIEADVFEYLRSAERAKEQFDLVILDPPAFAKTKNSLKDALRGYKEINLRAIKLLKKGGTLVTCSCSQALDEGTFRRMITEAAGDTEKRLIALDFRYQCQDHPVLVGYDESLYLKCGFYRIL